MAFGTNDVAITTNDLIKLYEHELVPRVEEKDAFAPFFKEMQKPKGIATTVNFEVDSTGDTAIQQPPLMGRESRKRDAYEVEIVIKDKYRDSRAISWEKIRQGRIDEPAAAVLNVAMSMARARNRELGRFIQTNAAQNSGVPTDPTAPATGQSAFWWNSNDTVAPPPYGENTFSVGEDHVETAITALTLDRIRVYIQKLVGKGYGSTGMTFMLQSAAEKTLLSLANVVQQNQTAGIALRDEFQRSGRASAVNGLMGLQIINSEWMSPGVCALVDDNLAGLPQGGAVRVVDLPLTSDTEDDKNKQATWFEATEQYGAGILHKGAGYTARVA